MLIFIINTFNILQSFKELLPADSHELSLQVDSSSDWTTILCRGWFCWVTKRESKIRRPNEVRPAIMISAE